MEYVTIFGEFQTETESAVCIDDGVRDDVWIPKSQLAEWNDDEYERGDMVELEVSEWFATKEGLI